jgi:formate dehydrogenase
VTASRTAPSGTTTRICPLCEACCGLDVTVDGERITAVRPNPRDVFSHGYACPKGLALASLDADPDRLRTPLVRDGGGWREVSWHDAFAAVDRALPPLLAAHGSNACAVYLGNPYGHNLDLQLYGPALLSALRTRNLFSAASVDSMPKHLATGLMFGTGFGIAVPDIDRTDHLLVLGSNLLVSNGSTMSAPGLPQRLRALRRRGGRLVVVDPVRTRTAAAADEHIPIRPGADAYLLLAMVAVIAEDDLVRLRAVDGLVDGLDTVLELAAGFPPEAVADRCGIPADVIRRLARDLARAERAAVHARIGTTTQEFGTLCSWLVDVLNVVTGNLDREGGAMFALPPAGSATTRPATGAGWPHGRWTSRVRKAPELQGELPLACLAEEIDTGGEGRVRALITVGGNPARSAPNSARLEQALGRLDFMVSVDTYLNETTRHADVILPAPRLATRGHFDLVINQTAVRNAARYSPPLLARAPGERGEDEIMLRLASIAAGTGPRPDLRAADDALAHRAARRASADPVIALAAVAPRTGAERLLDIALRAGPYGDRFGDEPDELTLDRLLAAPDGIDLGPLRPRLPGALRTPTGRIDLAPSLIVTDVERLRAGLSAPRPDLVLVGRRQMRGMNSWLHNALPLTRSGRCTLQVNPADATTAGLSDAGRAVVRSTTAEVEAEVEITDGVPPGVVSLPHGWGHDGGDLRLSSAVAEPGVNVNDLTDDLACEPLTGTPYFTGVPVTLAPTTR